MSDTNVLAARARRFYDVVMGVACGPGGMLIAFPRFDTRRPFQEGEEFSDYFRHDWEWDWGTESPKPTLAEILYGENTLWATGLFLWSQMARYQATREPEALETARKCFRDLNNIFRLCHGIEPGLLGKPHGGRAGPTWSYDQAAIPVLPYIWYAQQLATPEEKALAIENMTRHGDLYLRRNWVVHFTGKSIRIVGTSHPSQMKLLAAVHAAYDLTGEVRFRDAVLARMREYIAKDALPWPGNPAALNHNLWYWGLLCDYWSRTDLAAEADWQGYLREYWTAAQTALDAEGLVHFGQYDTANRTFTPYPEGWLTHDNKGQWKAEMHPTLNRYWVSSTNTNGRAEGSLILGMLALLARQRGLDDRAGELAERTLLRLDEADLPLYWDDGSLPAEVKPYRNVLSTETAAAWQLLYWEGRRQGVW